LGPSPDLPSEAIKADLSLRSSTFRTLRSARPISIKSGLSWSGKRVGPETPKYRLFVCSCP
jgi:hypothetical protein